MSFFYAADDPWQDPRRFASAFGGCLHKGPTRYYCTCGERNKQAKDKQMTFTAIVWSKKQFVTWRCAACLLSRKDCSVMKKINSTNNAEQPRPHVVCFSFDQPIVASGSRLSYARILLFPASTQYPAGSPITSLLKSRYRKR